MLFASKEVDGVVITHGTNTLEESADFLNLVVRSNKQEVMVGAMRPGSSMSADGPMKTLRSVVTAGSKQASGRGGIVVMNDQIIGARGRQKNDTMTVDTFKAAVFGYRGFAVDGKTHFYKSAARKHTTGTEYDVPGLTSLPRVDIVLDYEDDSRTAIDALFAAGAKGIVHPSAGTASVSNAVQPGIIDAVANNVSVVRSQRSSLGTIALDMEFHDDKFGTALGDTLNPPRACILLMLALTKTRDPNEIQRRSDTC